MQLLFLLLTVGTLACAQLSNDLPPDLQDVCQVMLALLGLAIVLVIAATVACVAHCLSVRTRPAQSQLFID
jgi:hypothetical protein